LDKQSALLHSRSGFVVLPNHKMTKIKDQKSKIQNYNCAKNKSAALIAQN